MTTSAKSKEIVSYAFNHEDVVLARAFADQATGFYIDVGANHPTEGSVTKVLSDSGWCGINVEPNPRLAHLLREARPRDTTLNVGVAERPGTLTLHEVLNESGLSTMSEEIAQSYMQAGYNIRALQVDVVTLADICQHHVRDRKVDILSIDVEGFEASVLAGADFTRWQPRVLVIESTLPYTNTLVHHEWEPGVLAAGYTFTMFDGVNRYYVRNGETVLAERLSYPATPLDRFVSSSELKLRQDADAYRRLGRVARKASQIVQRLVNLRRRPQASGR